MNQYKTLIYRCLTIRCTVCHHVAPHGVAAKSEKGGKEGSGTLKNESGSCGAGGYVKRCGPDHSIQLEQVNSDVEGAKSRYIQNCEAELLLSPLIILQ